MPPDEALPALLASLRRDLAALDRYAAEVDRDRFLRDADAQNMVLYAAYRASQTSIDIGQRILATRRLGPAETYADVFQRLGDANVLPADLARRLRGWAGLRNVIAHVYRFMDLETVFTAYTTEVGDLRAFADAVAALDEANPG